MSSENSFTLIELLIVIGILAILAVAVILVLNPAQFMAQARDSRRMSELQTINNALGQYLADGKTYLGGTNTVYVSIPDSNSTCANLGLPALPSGWSYHCSNSNNYRKVDGTGWIPVNFTLVSSGSPLNILPIDPENSTSTGQYYTYVIGGSYKLTALLESEKYASKMNKDGGPDSGIYEVGTNLNLANFARGLVGYWKFDEGGGTTAGDSSGSGNNGTLINGPTWTSGKVGGGLSFDKSNDYVDVATINSTQSDITLSGWFKTTTGGTLVALGDTSYPGVGITGGVVCANNNEGGLSTCGTRNMSDDNWHHFAVIIGSSGINIFTDGLRDGPSGSSFSSSGNNFGKIGVGTGYHWSFFGGLIDEVRIYNRALSDAEIAAIYNATK